MHYIRLCALIKKSGVIEVTTKVNMSLEDKPNQKQPYWNNTQRDSPNTKEKEVDW